ncbi:MAG: Leg1-related protein [Actinomycetota bacterium]|nr:Leg1-related protein [Actinomycetota bacterium]
MAPVAHPEELAELDLFEVWTGAAPLDERFDPFRFEQRMAAYRLLVDTINHEGRFGEDNRRNPLWGLIFQHQWQFRTDRLGSGTRQDGRIDPDAPWGYGNYALCVFPWLGAASAGLVPYLELVPPPTPSRFDYPSGGGSEPLRLPAEFEPGVADWKAFFLLVKGSQSGADQEPVRLALWKAHKTCLDVIAERIANIDPAPYSALELKFLRGWCRMVDYLWVAAWPTDFDFMTENGMDVLPERLLLAEDDLHALPEKVRGSVRNIIRLAETPGWRYTLNLTMWKRVMRTRAARDEVLAMLDAVFNPNPDNVAARRRMLGYLLRP